MHKKQHIDLYKVSCYEIYKNRVLGTGSYSVVYLGKCLDNSKVNKYNLKDSMVAIKKINMTNLTDRAIKMIREEIRVSKQLMEDPHPHIITFVDIIDDIDTIYIVMEHCDGGDLSKLLIKPMRENIVKYYLDQIIDGLIYTSSRNIIHRDIKPKNILLTNNMTTIKICDFGLAKIKDSSMSRINTVCGSPLYMAPEILSEKNYNTGVDIWAVGMILYEMFYGFHPLYKCKDMDELKTYMKNNDIKIPQSTHITIEGIKLLKSLLEKNDVMRITIQDIKDNVWLKNIKHDDIKQKLNETPNVHSILYYKTQNKYITDPKNPDEDDNTVMVFEMDS